MSDRQTGRTTRQIQDLVDCAVGAPNRTVVWIDHSAGLRTNSWNKVLEECGGRGVFDKAVKHEKRIMLTNGSVIQCIAVEQGLMYQSLEGEYYRVFVDHNAWLTLDTKTREWMVCRHRTRVGEQI